MKKDQANYEVGSNQCRIAGSATHAFAVFHFVSAIDHLCGGGEGLGDMIELNTRNRRPNIKYD